MRDSEDEGFRINSTQIQQQSESRRTVGEFNLMTAALTNLKNKPWRRQLNPVEIRKIAEESWVTYPNKLKILLDVYGGQHESDKQVTNLHDSIADFDNARSRKINAGLRDSSRGCYMLQCGMRNKNVPSQRTIDKKEDSPNELRFCCSVNYEKMDFQAISWEDIEEEYKEDRNLDTLRQATMNNNVDQIKEMLKEQKI